MRLRRILPGFALCALSASALAVAPTTESGRFALRGTVIRVVDGDTIHVRLASGRRERVRLIGIDAPERGRCYFVAASGRARLLALGKPVSLLGDRTQRDRDG